MASKKQIHKLGERDNKGWIYAGKSEKKPLWVAPVDEGVMTHYDAEDVVKKMQKKDARVRLATVNELKQAFFTVANGQKGIGAKFKKGSANPASNYWGTRAKSDSGHADFLQFSDGIGGQRCRNDVCSLRLVR